MKRERFFRDESRCVWVSLIEILDDPERIDDCRIGRRIVDYWKTIVRTTVQFVQNSLDAESLVKVFDIGIFDPLGLILELLDIQRKANHHMEAISPFRSLVKSRTYRTLSVLPDQDLQLGALPGIS